MSVKEIFETMDYGPAPESSNDANAWLERHKHTFDLFIGGKFVKPRSGEHFDTVNPANGEVIANIAQAGEKDVDAAVKAAKKAQGEWAKAFGARDEHVTSTH